MNHALTTRTLFVAGICLTLIAALALALLAQPHVAAQGQWPSGASALIIDATGAHVGVAGFSSADGGTKILLAVGGLAPGRHGVHIHANGSCEDSTNDQGQVVAFGAAGGHFDPHETAHHGGPEAASDTGHAGDLPNIEIGADGRGVLEVITDKVTLEDGPLSVGGRSIVIHANEDNYTDEPALGGSGPRVACGVIQPLAGAS